MIKRVSVFLLVLIYLISGELTVLPQMQTRSAAADVACCSKSFCQSCQFSGFCCCHPQSNQSVASPFIQKAKQFESDDMAFRQAPCGTTPVQEVTTPSVRLYLIKDVYQAYCKRDLYPQSNYLMINSQHTPFLPEKPPELTPA